MPERENRIIDIQDMFSMFQKQCGKRITFYHKSNFTLFKNDEKIEKRKRKKKQTELEEFALFFISNQSTHLVFVSTAYLL